MSQNDQATRPATEPVEPETRVDAKSGRGVLLFAVATTLSPIAFRLTEIGHERISPGLGDLRGLVADMGVALLIACFLAGLSLVARAGRFWIFGAPILLLWVILNNANLEHVRTLGTLMGAANAAFLLDGTFVTGSALHLSHPLLLVLLTLASLAALAFALRSGLSLNNLGPLLGLAALLLGIRLLIPNAEDAAGWRQTHFVLDNLRFTRDMPDQFAEERQIPGLYPASLNGQPTLPLDHRGQNVLLVVLEGVSGAYLDRMATVHGLDKERPRLESLDRLAREGYTLVNFINQQRQTNRGLYALLCGDPPKQQTSAPKMTELGMRQEDALCLPRALARNGYETAFLQSAPLAFMAKDKFMPRAGFSQFHGTEYFDAKSEKRSWGVDDREFLMQSLDMISELEATQRPWFLTLLTSGTHHPFHVPETFLEKGEVATFTRAIEFLDGALDEFIEKLTESGLREDTIILITSDESFGLEGMDGGLSDDELLLSQAWGVLVALLPSGEQAEVSVPYSQMDVAVSVLDVLGLQHESARFRGRSFFREYATSRAIPFANTYMRMSAMIEDNDSFVACREDGSDCNRFELSTPPLLFAGHTAAGGADPDDGPDAGITLLSELSARSQELAVLPKRGRGDEPIEWQLIDTPTSVLLDAEHFQTQVAAYLKRGEGTGIEASEELMFMPVFGNQYITLAADQRVHIELELEVRGDHPVELFHSLRGVPKDQMPATAEYRDAALSNAELRGLGERTLGMRPRFVDRTIDLGFTQRIVHPGEPFKLIYEYSTAIDLERLNARLSARNSGDGIVGLIVRRAQLQIGTLEEGAQAKGLEILEYTHRFRDPAEVAAN